MKAPDRPGLKQEHAPESQRSGQSSGDRAPVDIIAVQGLASTYERTWTKQLQDGSRVMWLKDLLPKDLPSARILTFEYDSEWLNDPSHVSLRDCADRLIESILWDRTHNGEAAPCRHMMRRPIVLLGHSFGGLVIKMALVRAAAILPNDSRYSHHRQLLTSIAGVVFLGTPHAGSNFAAVAGPWARAWSVVGYGSNLDLIRLLRPLESSPSGSDLQDLAEAFQSLQNEDSIGGLVSYYFWETKSVRFAGWDIAPVVNRTSACYGAAPECCFSLAVNHKDMNKFGSRDDDNYKRVMKALSSISIRAHAIVEKRLGKLEYDGNFSGVHQKIIKKWLDPAMLAGTIEKLQTSRVNGTCEWALSATQIELWLHPENDNEQKRTIWVYGKPGSGKSVLSAYLNDQAVKLCREKAGEYAPCQGIPNSPRCDSSLENQEFLPIALYFPLQKTHSVTTVAATLIDEILRWLPFNSRLQSLATWYINRNPSITLTASLDLLQLLVGQFSVIYITLDGFDECRDLSEFTQLLQAIHTAPGARVLLSGRKDEASRVEIERHVNHNIIQIDISDHNRLDIERFIKDCLCTMADTSPRLYTTELQEQVSQHIINKANGMFQWVNLILHDLRRHGQTKGDILAILDEFPNELDGAYTRTFARLSLLPQIKRKRAAITLKWLVAAPDVMKVEDLELAVIIQERWGGAVDSDLVSSAEHGQNYFEFLGALIEFREQTPGKRLVGLCHHSLEQWLDYQARSPNVPQGISPEFIFSRHQAHLQAAETCLISLGAPDSLREFFITIYRPCDTSAGFLNYAGENCHYHLRMCGPLAAQPTPGTGLELLSPAGPSFLILPEHQLQKELELTATVIAALSSALRRINPSSVRHLLQLVALRDIQIELLEAAQRVRQVHHSLPKLRSALEVLPHRPPIGFSPRGLGASRLSSSSDSFRSQGLNRKLQSPDFAMVARLLVCQKKELQPDIEVFERASEALRRTCLFLSAEPIRAYVYQLVGDKGLSPIPLLAHCAASLDTFLVSAATPATTVPQDRDFRSQIRAPATHPLFGHIMAARYELNEKRSRILGPSFYKRYILDHYRIRSWERNLLQLTAIALDMHIIDPSDPTGAATKETAVDHWLTNQVKVRQLRDEQLPPSHVIGQLRTRSASWRRISMKEVCTAVAKTGYVMFMRLLTFLSPNLQTSATNAVILARARARFAIPLARGLFKYPTPLAVAVGLYAIRCQRWPTLFTSPRNTPLKDLVGVVRDPLNYIATRAPSAGWMRFTGWLLQETFLGLTTFIDAVRVLHPELKPYIVPSWLRKFPSDVLGPVSESPIVKSIAVAVLNFWRLIFLERTVVHTLYLGYDVVKASATLLAPKRSIWIALVTYTSIFLPMFISGRYGFVGLFIFAAQVWAAIFVWGYLARTPIVAGPVGHIFRRLSSSLLQILAPVTGLLGKVYSSKAVTMVVWSIGRAVNQVKTLSPTARTLIGAPVVVLLFCGFIYTVSDPLHMRHAQARSKEAERIALQISCVKERPAEYLGWRNIELDKTGSLVSHMPFDQGLFIS